MRLFDIHRHYYDFCVLNRLFWLKIMINRIGKNDCFGRSVISEE